MERRFCYPYSNHQKEIDVTRYMSIVRMASQVK
ncbi:unnamed protein product [Brugia pahangi]|uniref:Transposase n=1 Tax=Brugia pahangi TaxID=6280 RepID=A0A0N4T2H1_BRUPA|nr:unnamed protein product [Brugia pahangi]